MSVSLTTSDDADDAFFTSSLSSTDDAVSDAIRKEFVRQQDQIELIASENIVSRAVLEAQGSVLTNKYAEGYPGRRYYGGCEYVDVVETLAIERAKELFGAGWANVQPHSGSQANQGGFHGAHETGRHFHGSGPRGGGPSDSWKIGESVWKVVQPRCLHGADSGSDH